MHLIDEKIIETFKIDDFTTLSNMPDKIRIELGTARNSRKRSEIAYNKAKDIVTEYFDGKEIYIRLILWDIDFFETKNSVNLSLLNDFIIEEVTDDGNLIIYYNINPFRIELVQEIIKGIINFDLDLKPSINATCYYIDFDTPILINIYDDRGTDIVIPEKN